MTREMTTTREVDELLARPYRKVIRGTAEDGYLAEAPELPGCVTAGETEAEALEMLQDAMAGWFETALARGLHIPDPENIDPPASGRVLVRMPPALHRHLSLQAGDQGVSLNQWIVALLAGSAAWEGLRSRRSA